MVNFCLIVNLYWNITFFGELRLFYYSNFIIKEILIKYVCLLYVEIAESRSL